MTINSYPFIIPLTSGPSTANPASLNNIGGTTVPWNVVMTPQPQHASSLRSKVVVNKQYVDLTVTAGNEDSLLQFTAFLVQLQPKVAQQTYADTSSMSSMTRDADFATPSTSLGVDSGYGPYINNQRYKILKRLEFETGGVAPSNSDPPQVGGSTGNVGRGTRSWYAMRTQFKVNYGSTVYKSSGDQENALTLEYSKINPEQKRFIVIFSDNGIGDLESPACSMSSLVTGYAAE